MIIEPRRRLSLSASSKRCTSDEGSSNGVGPSKVKEGPEEEDKETQLAP
jgi:hypothetical protein